MGGDNSTGSAQERFQGAKSISSSQMLSGNTPTEPELSSSTARFANSKSISSSQYFNRPPQPSAHTRAASGEIDLQELGANARDLAQRLLNSNEADNLRRMWAQGASKLSEYLDQLQER
ncbi:hypothetical protein EC988_005734 [Linderina pennispora]|nr:hypothetical protein EC988_005734 [Linderina pennispora]